MLAVGYAIFGFGFFAVGDISLSYTTDCYQDVGIPCWPFGSIQVLTPPTQIIGDAIIGVVLIRNILSVIVLFTITPWLNGMGVQNLHILTACLAFAILMLPVLFLAKGKAFRRRTAERYRQFAHRQPTHRVM